MPSSDLSQQIFILAKYERALCEVMDWDRPGHGNDSLSSLERQVGEKLAPAALQKGQKREICVGGGIVCTICLCLWCWPPWMVQPIALAIYALAYTSSLACIDDPNIYIIKFISNPFKNEITTRTRWRVRCDGCFNPLMPKRCFFTCKNL